MSIYVRGTVHATFDDKDLHRRVELPAQNAPMKGDQRMRHALLIFVATLVIATPPAVGYAVTSDTVTLIELNVDRNPQLVTIPMVEDPASGFELLSLQPAGNPDKFGKPTVFVEADGSVSDIIGVLPDVGNPATFDLTFESDSGAGFLEPLSLFGSDPSKFVFLPEGNGLSVNVTDYVLVSSGVLGAVFESDGDATVPEPGTLLLIGTGILGGALITVGRRRRLP